MKRLLLRKKVFLGQIKRYAGFLLLTWASLVSCQLYAAQEKPLFSIGVIADCQYADRDDNGVRLYRSSPAKLQKAVDHYNTLSLEFVAHLGDFIDLDWKSFDVLQPITDQLIHPLYHVLGNHDFSVEDDKKRLVPERLGLDSRYYTFAVESWRFVFIDGNDLSFHAWPKGSQEYLKSQKAYQNNYQDQESWNGAVGKEQLNWLAKTLDNADQQGESVVLFSHFPLYPNNRHNLWNATEVMNALEQHSSVVAWINGHNHIGDYAIKEDIAYLTIKGMLDTKITAYASMGFFKDHIEITGYGRQESLTIIKNINVK